MTWKLDEMAVEAHDLRICCPQCDFPMHVEVEVHPDGRLRRVSVVADADAVRIDAMERAADLGMDQERERE